MDTTKPGGFYVLLIGDYEAEILGVTHAAGPAAANMVAAALTAKRAEGYIITSGPNAGARSYYSRDMIAVRAEPIDLLDETGEPVDLPHREHTGRWSDTGEVTR